VRGEAVADDAAGAEREAMNRLGWSARDLHFATVAYGSVDLEELREHLRTGDHLPPDERAIVAATLHDELVDRGLPSPFALE
jgi:hypothetical protein